LHCHMHATSYPLFPCTTLFRSKEPHDSRNSPGHCVVPRLASSRIGVEFYDSTRKNYRGHRSQWVWQDYAITSHRWDLIPKCRREDRKSTRLNSSHVSTSYAVFC